MSSNLPEKIQKQMEKAGLPSSGPHPFKPKIIKNRNNDDIIDKQAVTKGPKSGKRGFVDEQGRIWIKDRAHAHVGDHWDVQIDGGEEYFRVDQNGNEIP